MYHHFHHADVIKIRLQMQLAGQRGNLVGMVSTASGVASSMYHLLMLNLIVLVKPIRGQYLHKW